MRQYHELLDYVMTYGVDRGDRTGTGTRGVFGYQMRFDLSEGFPLMTTKRLHMKSIIHELLWFLAGDTNIKYLNDNGVTIWDEWADENGDLGPVYGKQWRSWPTFTEKESVFGIKEYTPKTIDQISNVIEAIKKNPYSRRHIVSAWNPAEVDQMALPPCHCLFQFYVEPISEQERGKMLAEKLGRAYTPEEKGSLLYEQALKTHSIPTGRLSCQLYQRSADIFLGVPFNIASYALLTILIAAECNLEPGEFIHTLGDAHIYHNHFDQVREQLSRQPKPLPKLWINPDKNRNIFTWEYEDFVLMGYDSDPSIKAPIAV